jgi:hypothetical protein
MTIRNFSGEIKNWQLKYTRKGNTRIMTIVGEWNGKLIKFEDISVADIPGYYLIGVGRGKHRRLFKAYSITRKTDEQLEGTTILADR